MIRYVRLVNSRFSSNTYILYKEGKTGVWLVDPGDFEPVADWIGRTGHKCVDGVLLTHAHFDHIYGLNEVMSQFPHVKIFVSNEYGRSLLYDDKKNGSKYTEEGPFVLHNLDADIHFYGTTQNLLGEEIDVIYTPGHSEDSVCLRIDDLLFTGDTVIKDTRTVTKLRGGSADSLKVSIKKLSDLKGKKLIVCPGHGDCFGLDDYDPRVSLYGRNAGEGLSTIE